MTAKFRGSKAVSALLLVALQALLSACGGGSDGGTTVGGGGGGASPPAFTGPDNNGLITFETITPSSWVELVVNGVTLPRTNITGILYMPAGAAGPVPAMVVGHGSQGTGAKQIAWAADLNAMGIAAFVIDNFGPRGIVNGQGVTSAVETADALYALAVLRSLPQIDGTRIGVMDFGGAMGYASGFDEVRQGVSLGGAGFSVHVTLYPNCNIRQRSANITSAPIWFLHGDLDDWNTSAACADFVSALNGAGGRVTMRTYAGAYHGFDGNAPVSIKANVSSNRLCAGEFRLDTRVLRRFDNGMVFTGRQEYLNYLGGCRVSGATTGGNAMARAQALADIDGLLKGVFGL